MPKFTIKLALTALLAIGLLVLGSIVIYRVFFAGDVAKTKIAEATAGTVVATGREAAAQDATKIVERYHDRTTEIRTVQTDGVASVMAAADAAAGGVAARRAICLLDDARQLSDPACKVL